MKNIFDKNDMPLGLGMALAMNQTAMDNFSALSDSEKQEIIDHTHVIRSRKEMHAFVESIAKGVY